MTCPIQDESCRACAYCVGGQFIPTTEADCQCDGSGCANPDHWSGVEKCAHGSPVFAVCDPCWVEANDEVERMREFVDRNTAPSHSPEAR